MHRKNIIKILIVLVLAVWAGRVIWLNYTWHKLEHVKREYYEMGENVLMGHNYSFGEYYDTLSICIDSYRVQDIDSYLEETNAVLDSYLIFGQKLCLVDLTLRNTGDEAIDFSSMNFYLFSDDFIMGQNIDIYAAENELEDPYEPIHLEKDQEKKIRVVFEYVPEQFSKSEWAHVERYPLYLYLTAHPVQKNIVLQH